MTTNTYNKYMHRKGQRAKSEMRIRNTYLKVFGIQYYLIVEGESDERFFENILNCETCKVVSLGGKDEVKDFIEKENRAGKRCYLGVVDADFEHITGYEKTVDNIILTDYHDIEMVILSSNPNMRRIYSEFTDNIIIKQYEDKNNQKFIDSVINAAYEIGLLKLIMKRPRYKIEMKELPYFDFINDSFGVDIATLINRVKGRNHTEYEIKQELDNEKQKNHDKFQVVCGHDVTNILALCFVSREKEGFGYGNKISVKKEVIEGLLRAIYDFKHFVTTEMYANIIDWEVKNHVRILDDSSFIVA